MKPPVTLTCATCGKQFQRPYCQAYPANRQPTQHFCNSVCSHAYRRGEVRRCQSCGKEFYLHRSTLQKPQRTGAFCSNQCKGPHLSRQLKGRIISAEARARQSATMRGRPSPKRKPDVTVACTYCAAPIIVPGRKAYRATPARRFCNTQCWYAYLRENREAHARWRGGHRYDYGPNWQSQAAQARARDGNTCQRCGLVQFFPALDVHHIRPRRAFGPDWEAANTLDNLTTLCHSCHTLTEWEASLRPVI